MRRQYGFTLVELLVVIGIIALLVAILLPVLNGARRQANAVKCATQLREIGNAFQMYAMENRGYYPPSQLQPGVGAKYNIDGVDYPPPGGVFGAYWFNFLAKYVTKAKMGEASGTNTSDADQARKTIFWGCPSWETYRRSASADGLHPTQVGFGMTYWATVTLANPATTDYPPADQTNFIINWRPNAPESSWVQGRFFKQKMYDRHATQRALVADSRFWSLNSSPGPQNGILPRQMTLRNDLGDYNGSNQTYADIYRHGKYPPVLPGGQLFSNQGGKIAFNILYCDGHVATTNDWREAYRAVRMRFPG